MSDISRVKYEYETQRLNKLLAEKQIDLDYHIRECSALRQEIERSDCGQRARECLAKIGGTEHA